MQTKQYLIPLALLGLFVFSPLSLPATPRPDPLGRVHRQADIPIKGRITDEGGLGLAGVTVSIKGTTRGTTTNANGEYTLNASETATLIYSFVGYANQEIAVGNRSTIDVQLLPDTRMLNEVQVVRVGYGEQKRRDVTGAIGSVDMKTIQNVPIQTADQALQGRIAGVDVQSNSGVPGNGVKVSVRGTGTINNSDPLYVIDGFYPASINNINPNDIASIDVLKDASATAIYGVLGANGVVIVTTKRAKAGKPTITLDSYYGSQKAIKFLPLLGTRDFATVSNNAKDNGTADNNSSAWLSGRPGNILQAGSERVPSLANLDNLPLYDAYDSTRRGERIDTDWQRAVYRAAPLRNINLTVAGGSENARILASVGYLKQDGIVQGSDFERISARINGDVTYKRFKVGTTIYFAQENRLQNIGGTSGTTASITKASPALAIYNLNPKYTLGFNGNERDRDGQDAGNPLRDLIISDNRGLAYTGYGTAFLEYEFIPGLKYRLNTGVNLYMGSYNSYNPVYYSSSYDFRAPGQNSLYQNDYRSVGWLVENTVSYEKRFGKHYLTALAGYVSRSENRTYFEAQKLGFPDGDRIRVADAGGTVTLYNGNNGQTRQVGLLGRINYEYNDRYLLTVNVRRDGSSRFARDYRYGVFPSASLGWRVSEEPFLKNRIPALSELKLRAGWGQIGNQNIGDYRYQQTININARYLFGQNYVSGGGTVSDAATANLKWETTAQTNVGLDFGFFGNRLSGSIDLYDKVTSDILLQAPIEASTGIDGRPTLNVGRVKNQGLELAAQYQQTSGGIDWSLGGNISFVNNRVLSLNVNGDQTAFLPGGADNSNSNRFLTRAAVGQPVGVFYGLVVDRIIQNNSDLYYANAADGNSASTYGGGLRPGDIKYKDLNGDGIINDADQTVIGSPIPKFTYGFYGRAGYRGFDVQVQFNGVYGSQIYNAARYWTEGMQRNFNYDANTLNRWVSEVNPGNGKVPRANSNDANNGQVSNRYIEDGSFLRLRNLTVGYNFPAAIRSKLGNMSNLRVYATATNLLTLTHYTGYDPEIGSGYRQDPNAGDPSYGSNLNRNIDNANYPIARSFLAGIQLAF